MAIGVNPTKAKDGMKYLPRLAQTVEGYRKQDPHVIKKLPVEADVPEYLVKAALGKEASEMEKAVGDLALVAFYYLLRVGEYTKKGTRNESKRTVAFKMEDITFFNKNERGQWRQIPRDAPEEVLLTACGATLKLDNQKNGWKNVCVFQQSNGAGLFDPVLALARRYVHVRSNTHAADFAKAPLSTVVVDGERKHVTDKHIRAGLKLAATALDYPRTRSIPINRIDTHSLRIGGANALSLSGYSDTQIQKMGRWRGATFKDYIREQLACFAEGMTTAMRQQFNFVNVEGGVASDITDVVVTLPYEVDNHAAAA